MKRDPSEARPYYRLQIEGIPCDPPSARGDEYDSNTFGRDMTQRELKALYTNEDVPRIIVEDNGECGDGVYLRVVSQYCHLAPEVTEANPCPDVVCIAIPDSSLPLLIAALQAVQRMREAEREADGL